MDTHTHFGSEYIARIKQIWKLNEPPAPNHIPTGDFYHAFHTQYEQARILSRKNTEFTKQEIFPLIQKEALLSEEEVAHLQEFCDELIAMKSLEFMDWVLCLKLRERLIQDASAKGEMHLLLLNLNPTVHLLYHLCDVFRRESTSEEERLQTHYRNAAISYIEQCRKWLVPSLFSTLTLEEQTAVLSVNHMETLFWYPHEKTLRTDLKRRLKAACSALRTVQDPALRAAAPDYPWDTEEDICLYYVTICGGVIYQDSDIDEEDFRIIYDACLAQQKWLAEGKPSVTDTYENSQMVSYMRYLNHELTPDDYLADISKDYLTRDVHSYNMQGITENLFRPVQILEVLVHHLNTEEHLAFYKEIYQNLLSYTRLIPLNSNQELLCAYTLMALDLFQEVEGGITFAELSATILANCSPSTYVHSQMVGKIARLITETLLEQSPDLFIHTLGYDSLQEVLTHKSEIAAHTERCGLYHDLGKLPYLDTIGITYRPLFGDELDIIRLHPEAGYNLLKKHASTAIYADVSLGHHKWFDDSRGYPSIYTHDTAHDSIYVDIIAISDCLDAATDIIFRSYNRGITLDDYIQEVREGAGTRYSNFVEPAFVSHELRDALDVLLTVGREQTYLEGYKCAAAAPSE